MLQKKLLNNLTLYNRSHMQCQCNALVHINNLKGLGLTSVPVALFKHSKKINYFIKKSKISIFNALITLIF